MSKTWSPHLNPVTHSPYLHTGDYATITIDCEIMIPDSCDANRTVKSGCKTRKPWLSEGLKKSIERKNKQYHRKQKTKNQEHEIIYKKYRNKLNKLVSIVEWEYYKHRLQENKQNLKASWRFLKDILNKNKNNLSCSRFYINNTVCNDKKRIAQSFNSFFVNVGPNSAKNIPSDSRSPKGYHDGA